MREQDPCMAGRIIFTSNRMERLVERLAMLREPLDAPWPRRSSWCKAAAWSAGCPWSWPG
ncbi:MAG: exodeoxyribonuclease V subunit gamma [Desulfobacterales bacterium]|nr:exodeoxyribonuclease V subunit gamma [Desulfobacterales bacterium]